MENIAVIGPTGSGKSTLISAILDNPLEAALPPYDVSIQRGNGNNFIEFNIKCALEYIELVSRCTTQIFVFDPFTSTLEDLEQFVEITSTKVGKGSILILLNKIDKVTQKPNREFLEKFLQTYNLYRKREEDIELMEVASLYRSQIEPIKKWISVRKNSYSMKVEEMDVILFKLGADGPQEVYSNLPSAVFSKEMTKEEFVLNFIINASVQLTQGEVYPSGVFVIPGGHTQSTKAVTFTWRMHDLDEGRDHRLEQGMFFLSIFLPITSPLLSLPLSLLEKRFASTPPINYGMIENPMAYLHLLLPKIFPEVF